MDNNYKEYLDSYAWKALKKMKLEEQPDCECCGVPATTVHHLSYERRGSEREDDIVSICEKCHYECHHVNGYQIKNDEEILRKRFDEVREEKNGHSNTSNIIEWSKDCKYVLDKDGNETDYSICNNYVFYYHHYMKNVNPDTFEVIEYPYSKDHKFIFYDTSFIPNSHPDTFEILNSKYSKDKNNVYYMGKKLEGAQPDIFEIIDKEYSTDKNNVYYRNNIIPGIKGDSFCIVYQGKYDFFKDTTNVYVNRYGKISQIEGLDSSTFKILETINDEGDIIVSDANQIYIVSFNNIIYLRYDVSVDTFKVLTNIIFKDKNYVYLNHFGYVEQISEVDSKTFQIIRTIVNDIYEYIFCKDINTIYYISNNEFSKISGSDSVTFTIINNYIMKDKNYVYFLKSGKIEKGHGIDPNSLQIINQDFIKDNKGVYYNQLLYKENKFSFEYGFYDSVIDYADPKSFELINDEYSKDKNYVFYRCGRISYKGFFGSDKYADPTTFKVIDENYAVDKNNKYFKGKVLE